MKKMIYNNKEVILKNGEKCLLRSPTQEDAEKMLEFLVTCSKETPYILRYPEECTETIEQEATFLEHINTSFNEMMIVAIVNGKIAGNCLFIGRTRKKVKHRCSMAIGLVSEFWNLGIGTAMINELTKVAVNFGCTQMELECIDGNVRGKALYTKCGFKEFGRIPKAIVFHDGSYADEILMIKEF